MKIFDSITQTVTIAQGNSVSAAFQILNWAFMLSALLPTFDVADIGLEVTVDGGDNWYTVLNPLTGAPAVIATGVTSGVVDFGDHVRSYGPNDKDDNAKNSLMSVRFTSSAAQVSDDVDIEVTQRG
ncbi:hypothetical protein KAR91_41310 [Candidatus Pacearchaeota archaeon]|nr:hypothetical protein [Candidatus Pacearchaeota archaeon]